MNLIVMPGSKKEIKKCYELVDGYILSLENLSVNVNFSYKEKELFNEIEFLKSKNKKVYVSLNKNMHNDDIKFLTEVLFKLEESNIDGVFFYDVSLVNIKNRNNLKINLVWNQEHMTTNYMTSEFWYQNGVSSTMLSYEITKDEINQISKSSSSNIFVPIFGYQPIFTSKRMLLTYYKEEFDIIDDSKVNYIHKEGSDYPIIEENDTFTVFTAKMFNGLPFVNELVSDYFVFNSIFLNSDEVHEILIKIKKEGIKSASSMIDEKYNTDTGFLNKKTIYKVKKDEE